MLADLETIAEHEAAHAIMKWIVGQPATGLIATTDGGFCMGSGKPEDPADALLVTMAGYAYELGLGLPIDPDVIRQIPEAEGVTSEGHSNDFMAARHILEGRPYIRLYVNDRKEVVEMSVDDARIWYLTWAQQLLFPHSDLIETMGWRLQHEGRMSARSVAAMLREYGKRNPAAERRKELRREVAWWKPTSGQVVGQSARAEQHHLEALGLHRDRRQHLARR